MRRRTPTPRDLWPAFPELGRGQRQISFDTGTALPFWTNLPVGCAFAERCHKAKDACRAGGIEISAASGQRAVRCIDPEIGGQRTRRDDCCPGSYRAFSRLSPSANG